MDKVRVSKESLLTALTENREAHRTQFEEAYENWKNAVHVAVNDLANNINAGAWDVELNPVRDLPKPSHHLKDYDMAIRMLEMSVDDDIEIEQYEFTRYVMDEWDWKIGFANTMSLYNG